jgi:hypothetical protein
VSKIESHFAFNNAQSNNFHVIYLCGTQHETTGMASEPISAVAVCYSVRGFKDEQEVVFLSTLANQLHAYPKARVYPHRFCVCELYCFLGCNIKPKFTLSILPSIWGCISHQCAWLRNKRTFDLLSHFISSMTLTWGLYHVTTPRCSNVTNLGLTENDCSVHGLKDDEVFQSTSVVSRSVGVLNFPDISTCPSASFTNFDACESLLGFPNDLSVGLYTECISALEKE